MSPLNSLIFSSKEFLYHLEASGINEYTYESSSVLNMWSSKLVGLTASLITPVLDGSISAFSFKDVRRAWVRAQLAFEELTSDEQSTIYALSGKYFRHSSANLHQSRAERNLEAAKREVKLINSVHLSNKYNNEVLTKEFESIQSKLMAIHRELKEGRYGDRTTSLLAIFVDDFASQFWTALRASIQTDDFETPNSDNLFVISGDSRVYKVLWILDLFETSPHAAMIQWIFTKWDLHYTGYYTMDCEYVKSNIIEVDGTLQWVK